MAHLYDDKGSFIGWDDQARADLDDLLDEMSYFVTPILIGGTMQPNQLDLAENYARATKYLEAKVRMSGVPFKRGQASGRTWHRTPTQGTPIFIRMTVLAIWCGTGTVNC